MSDLLPILFVIIFAVLIGIFTYLGRKSNRKNLREIKAFSRLGKTIGLAVEDGTRLHVSLGHGSLTNMRSAAGFVGLSMLKRITLVASESDHPPFASAGDGALAILAQDTLRSAHDSIGTPEEFDPQSGRVTGLTPFSYAAGLLPLIAEEDVSGNMVIGAFGSEVALLTEAGERAGSFTLAGTDSVPAQAVLYATAQEPLIGEELFTGGAYVNAGPTHIASLQAQDVMRWLIAGIIVIGGLLKIIGL